MSVKSLHGERRMSLKMEGGEEDVTDPAVFAALDDDPPPRMDRRLSVKSVTFKMERQASNKKKDEADITDPAVFDALREAEHEPPPIPRQSSHSCVLRHRPVIHFSHHGHGHVDLRVKRAQRGRRQSR